jgi:hypothetical protein
MYRIDGKCMQNFNRKAKIKETHGIPKRRWEKDIKMYLKEIGCGVNLSGSGYGPEAGSCENDYEPSAFKKVGNFFTT